MIDHVLGVGGCYEPLHPAEQEQLTGGGDAGHQAVRRPHRQYTAAGRGAASAEQGQLGRQGGNKTRQI